MIICEKSTIPTMYIYWQVCIIAIFWIEILLKNFKNKVYVFSTCSNHEMFIYHVRHDVMQLVKFLTAVLKIVL